MVMDWDRGTVRPRRANIELGRVLDSAPSTVRGVGRTASVVRAGERLQGKVEEAARVTLAHPGRLRQAAQANGCAVREPRPLESISRSLG